MKIIRKNQGLLIRGILWIKDQNGHSKIGDLLKK